MERHPTNQEVCMKHCKYICLLLANCCLATATALAQDYVVWSGGIGADERESAPQQGTKLEFFAEGGKFVAEVKVQVKDSGGKVLVDTVSEGPWLVLNLPAGRYSVLAQVNGAKQGGYIEVDGSTQKFSFMFAMEQ
jgi:hypothetical protein